MALANGLGTSFQGGSGTRERLLGAAISLFSDQGYAATGTRAIAARAGCNVALISHYFGSKEGLLREVIVRGIATVGDELRALRAEPMTPEARLARFIDYMVDHFDRYCQGLQIVFHQLAQAQSPFFASILPKIAENVELLTAMLEDAKGARRLRNVEPRTAAVLLMGMLQTYFATYTVSSTLIGPRSPETIAELKRHITESSCEARCKSRKARTRTQLPLSPLDLLQAPHPLATEIQMKNVVNRSVLLSVISVASLIAPNAGAETADTLDARLAPPSAGGGLTPEQVATRAKQTSFDAAQKREALHAAEAKVDEALVAYYPKLQLFARYQRLSPVNVPSFNVNGQSVSFLSPVNLTVLQAALTIPLTDYVLRISQSYAAASRSKRAAMLDEQAARLKAAADGRQAYYAWLRAKAQVVVAERALDQSKGHLDDARHSFEVGTASKADVLQVEAQVAAAELLLEQAKNLAAINEEQIRIAMHDPSAQPYAIGEDLRADFPMLPAEDTLAVLRKEAFEKRLEIRALNQTAWSLREQGKAARAAYYPRIDAIGDLFYSNPNPRIFPQTQTFAGTWDVGVLLTWSPNDALNARGTASESDARAAQTEFQKDQLRDSVRLEVMQAYQATREAEIAVRTTKRGLDAAEESYRVRRELFKNGRATSVELTDSEVALTRAGVEAINARANLRAARASLNHATGRDVPPGLVGTNALARRVPKVAAMTAVPDADTSWTM